MPDIIVHTSFGAQVLERLAVDVDRDIYDFGLVGPDPFLFYRFYIAPFRHRVNRYSSTMHRERTGDFLIELIKRGKGDREVFSYAAGFLCHYALDSNTHPYINRKAKGSFPMHMAIEHKLDRMNGGEVRIPRFLPESMKDAVGGAITRIYGWDDAWEKFRQGHRDMKPFYAIVTDKSGLLDKIASKTHSKLALVSYRSKAIDDMDLRGFYPLYRRAVEDAVRFISAAHDFIQHKLDETALREIIGNRSYIDG
jgi:hypothetical protein